MKKKIKKKIKNKKKTTKKIKKKKKMKKRKKKKAKSKKIIKIAKIKIIILNQKNQKFKILNREEVLEDQEIQKIFILISKVKKVII